MKNKKLIEDVQRELHFVENKNGYAELENGEDIQLHENLVELLEKSINMWEDNI